MDYKKIEEYLLGLPKMEYRGVPDSYVLEDLSEAWTVCGDKFETGKRSLGDMYRVRQNNGYISFEDGEGEEYGLENTKSKLNMEEIK